MADKKISAATATTPAADNFIPIAKSGDSTAYYLELGQVIGMAGVTNLNANSSASATTISVNALPSGAGTYFGYVVIDPYTTECEVRKVTGLSGTTVTVSALTYAHAENDAVLWIIEPRLNALWFGAKGNDSTNNATPLQRWLDQAKAFGKTRCYLPQGIYQTGTGLDLADTNYNDIHLIGDGYNSVIKAAGAITILSFNTGFSGGIEKIFLDGNNVATTGMYVGNTNQFHCENINIENVDASPGRALVLDRTQNSYFANVRTRYCNDSLIIANGANNNAFYWYHASTDGGTPNYGCFIGPVSGLTNYAGDSTDYCLQNKLFGGLFERGEVVNTLRIIDSHRNLFFGTDFFRGAETATPAVYVGSGCNQNKFIFNRFMNRDNTTEPVINNLGSQTVLLFPHFGNTPANANWDCIHSQDMIHVIGGYFDTSNPIDVTSGNIYDGVGMLSDIAGYAYPTASRPDAGESYMNIFDTDFRKPFWYDAQADAWVDAMNSRYTINSPTELTISGGVITVTRSFHKVDTEEDGGTDDLDTITNTNGIGLLVLRAENGTRDVVAKDGTGNLQLAGDFTMDTLGDTLTLIWDAAQSKWLELMRSNNA